MIRLAVVLAPLLALLMAGPAAADDATSSPPSSVAVGQQFQLILEVEAPADAEVEIDTVGDGWNGLEVISIDRHDVSLPEQGPTRHTFTLTVAAFAPGELTFTPAAIVTVEGLSQVRQLPSAETSVRSSLTPGETLELSPIAVPGAVDGAQSPFLVPGLVAIAVLFLVTLMALTWAIVRRLRSRPRSDRAEPAEPGILLPDLDGVEAQLGPDPVAAYRAMAAMVRGALATRYGFPARALTSHELQSRMEAEGVDRWLTRLVSGLLDECDAVIYAGYRPAMERRAADLNMAREVLEGSG